MDERKNTFQTRPVRLIVFPLVPVSILLPLNNFYIHNFKQQNKLITFFTPIISLFLRLLTGVCSRLFLQRIFLPTFFSQNFPSSKVNPLARSPSQPIQRLESLFP